MHVFFARMLKARESFKRAENFLLLYNPTNSPAAEGSSLAVLSKNYNRGKTFFLPPRAYVIAASVRPSAD